MRREMEYVRWQLDHWLARIYGRDWSIFTETKKIAHYVWQLWKRGAFLVLVLAFMPILFPLVLFLSFVGFICVVPLLCGAATYYLFFRKLSLPLSITEFIYPSNCPSEGLVAGSQSGEEVESMQDRILLKPSSIGEGVAEEVPRRTSDAKTILLLECELLGNERVEEDKREYQHTKLMEVYGKHPNGELVFSEHTAHLASTSESSETPEYFRRYAHDGKDCRVGNRILTGNTKVMTGGTPCSRMHKIGEEVEDWADSNVARTLNLSTMSSAEVLNCKPIDERDTNSMDESPPELSSCISEEFIEALVKSTSTLFSDSTLTTSEDIARADSHMVHPKYWRDEVEYTELSSQFAKVACVENLECAQAEDVFSASQTSNYGQYKENMVEGENGRIDPSLSSLFTHQRRLSFSNALTDEKLVSPGCCFPSEKLNHFMSPQQSVSSSFCLDYSWSSGSSEQGFEFRSTQGASYEESQGVYTASSTAPDEESEKNLEPAGAVSDSAFFPTPDQLTEDWKARRERWEEESTPGRLVPLSPYMEAHFVEARSICNPLFEFSTPSPPLKKLKVTQDISNSPSPHTRFSKRHLAQVPESPRTHVGSSGSIPSPHPFRIQKRKSGMNRLDSDHVFN